MLAGPRWPELAALVRAMDAGMPPPAVDFPVSGAVFCADFPVTVHDYDGYAALVREARSVAPTVRYGAGLLAVQTAWDGSRRSVTRRTI